METFIRREPCRYMAGVGNVALKDTFAPTLGMDLLKEEYMEAFVNGLVNDISFQEFLNKKLET